MVPEAWRSGSGACGARAAPCTAFRSRWERGLSAAGPPGPRALGVTAGSLGRVTAVAAERPPGLSSACDAFA